MLTTDMWRLTWPDVKEVVFYELDMAENIFEIPYPRKWPVDMMEPFSDANRMRFVLQWLLTLETIGIIRAS